MGLTGSLAREAREVTKSSMARPKPSPSSVDMEVLVLVTSVVTFRPKLEIIRASRLPSPTAPHRTHTIQLLRIFAEQPWAVCALTVVAACLAGEAVGMHLVEGEERALLLLEERELRLGVAERARSPDHLQRVGMARHEVRRHADRLLLLRDGVAARRVGVGTLLGVERGRGAGVAPVDEVDGAAEVLALRDAALAPLLRQPPLRIGGELGGQHAVQRLEPDLRGAELA